MRTVTFSDKQVAEHVNSTFVPVWFNRGIGFHNCEKWTETRIFTSAADCYPTKNICTFFLTPDLEVVYYVAGYWGPSLFNEILEHVVKLQSATPDTRAAVHTELASILAGRLSQVQAGEDEAKPLLSSYGACRYEKLDHKHGPSCLHVLSEAFRYRKEVHDQLAGSTTPLEKVQFAYKFGNPFTEEAPPPPDVKFARPETPTSAAPAVATRRR